MEGAIRQTMLHYRQSDTPFAVADSNDNNHLIETK